MSSKRQILSYGDRTLHLLSKKSGQLLYLLFFIFFSAPYVKVYLLENGVCIAKKKTKVARKTLEPLYQQLLSFEESPQGKVLQVTCISILLNLKVSAVQFALNEFQTPFMLHLASSAISNPC